MPATPNNATPSLPTSVVRLPLRSASVDRARRNPAELLAALRAEQVRHDAANAAIYAEMAVALSEGGTAARAPAGERRHTKKQAAAELGLTESRLMRIIGRYHAQFPHHPPLAVQPGGSKHSPWIVYTDRVRAVMDRVCCIDGLAADLAKDRQRWLLPAVTGRCYSKGMTPRRLNSPPPDLLTESLHVGVSLDVKRKLEAVARREDRSVASVVRRAVADAIGRSAQKPRTK